MGIHCSESFYHKLFELKSLINRDYLAGDIGRGQIYSQYTG